MNSSISIRNLGLSFGKIEVLKDLNLEVHDGEFLVLLGSSGCGKSTLLNCIAGLLDVSDGQYISKVKMSLGRNPETGVLAWYSSLMHCIRRCQSRAICLLV